MRLTSLLLALVLLLTQVPAKPKIEVTYDRFTDTTTAKIVGGLRVTGEGEKEISIAVWATFKGEKPTEKPKLLLRFVRFADYASKLTPLRYEGVETVYVLADSERMELAVKGYEGKKTLPFISETAPVELTDADAEKLSRGKKIEVRWGSSEFALTPESVSALRDFFLQAAKRFEK